MMCRSGLFAFLLAVSCRATAPSSEIRVVDGSPLTASHPGNQNAVLVDPSCTGALIARNIVITAAHCVDLEDEQPGTVEFETVDSPNRITVAVTERHVHPDYPDVFTVSPGYDFGLIATATNDIAWLKLESDAPLGFKPLPLIKAGNGPEPGSWMSFVGYGATGTEDDAQSGIKLKAEVSVHKVLNDNWHRGVILSGPDPVGGACFGDSGGPAYQKQGDEWVIAGLVHGAGREYATHYDRPLLKDDHRSQTL